MNHLLATPGQSIVNNINQFWLVLLVKAGAVVLFFLVAPLGVGYMEHKVLAHMQHRLGPMYAGRFHGWAQLIADGVKFVQKEDVIPTAADRFVFTLAPAVVMIPYILLFVVVPFGNDVFAENLNIGIFFVLAITSLSVIGVLMAGWASANKFSLIGALRAAAQLIAYELPLILSDAAVVMQAGTLSLIGITEAQHHYWFVFPQAVGFGIFVVSSLAELSRPPFDMPIADSEIIFGAYTEYTGLKFAFFLLAEYGGIVALSAIASVLFLVGVDVDAPVGALARALVADRAVLLFQRDDASGPGRQVRLLLRVLLRDGARQQMLQGHHQALHQADAGERLARPAVGLDHRATFNTAVMRMSASASGIRTVHDSRWSWSSRRRGYVARSQMTKKESAPIFPAIHSGAGMNDRSEIGRYPPRNSTLAIADNATMPPYSASRKNANFRPVYSVMAPKMISESATGMSNGGRDSSASDDTTKIANPMACGNTNQ